MNINDIITESQQACPHCGGPMFSEMMMMEKKDACYYKVKASAKVWPSAYASGRLVQCRKKGAANYGNKSEGVAEGAQQGMKNKGGRQVPNCVLAESMVEGSDPGILFYAKDPAAQQKIYARVKDAEHLALLQQRYRGAEIKTFDYRRPDVIKWLEARGINLRKFVPGMIQTMPDVSDSMTENYRYRRDAYQRDLDNAEYGMGRHQSRAYQQDGGANDESNELDPSEWYIVKDGKMFKATVYPNQVQSAMTQGYSPSREEAKARAGEQGLNEFAPGGDDDGSDGFSDDTLRQLAAQWYNGDEDPRVESTLMAAGWEIGQDEGYDDTPGVFVVQAGDINGRSYISWPAHELEGLTEATDPEIVEMYEAMQQLAEEMAASKGVSVDLVWESFEALDDHMLYETAAWRRKEGKSKKGGLNAKGVASYRRENPGSKLQMAVTTKPSKLKPGSKAAKRRKSFCARMGGVKGPMKKPNGKPTRKAMALRKWNC